MILWPWWMTLFLLLLMKVQHGSQSTQEHQKNTNSKLPKFMVLFRIPPVCHENVDEERTIYATLKRRTLGRDGVISLAWLKFMISFGSLGWFLSVPFRLIASWGCFYISGLFPRCFSLSTPLTTLTRGICQSSWCLHVESEIISYLYSGLCFFGARGDFTWFYLWEKWEVSLLEECRPSIRWREATWATHFWTACGLPGFIRGNVFILDLQSESVILPVWKIRKN